jgi:predicted CXXCH cytochrome family protein
LAVAASVAAAVAFARGADAAGKSSCEVCHSKVAVAYGDSVHQNREITCVDCHGGDPTDMEITAMSHGEGFKGRPTRREIPRFCARCHADRALMGQYGLSTHQFEDYQTSRHGKAWLAGNDDAAVCTDCHGQHAILPPDDPRSTTARLQIPKTCGRCHADQALMARHGLRSDVVAQYEESAHGKAVLKGGSDAAAVCTSCHGSHTALPPGQADIPQVCAQCHRNVEETVRESPHHNVPGPIGRSACEVCHGHHTVQHPTPALLNTACLGCHPAGSSGYQTSQALFEVLSRAEKDYAQAKEALQALHERGVYVTELETRMEGANTALLEAARVQHALDRQKLEEKTVVVEAIALDVALATKHLGETLAVRRMSVGLIWAYIGLSIGFLYWKKRRLTARELGPAEPQLQAGSEEA